MATYKVNIAEPCTESWDKMKPTGCGAFCHSCQKEVIDFSTKSTTEIATILHKANGSVCGRFNNKQLEAEYEYQPLLPPDSWFRKGLVGAALSLLVAAFTTQAQTPTGKPKVHLETKKENGKVVFAGVVVDDSTKTPLNDVVVTYACNPAYKVVTDYSGKFKIEIDRKEYSDSLFEFTRMGYGLKQASLAPSDNIAIEMKMVGVTLPTINIESIPFDKDIRMTVGAMVIVRPSEDNRSGYSVGMFLRHYLGINYWD